ncbi:hypothetical protein [Craterilacuibacter sp.]|uniref:hypothetical protein n=1 Tax=Craterilacuibacter sp. TaxID=2870909 RepID=UPI003F364984
MAKPDTRDAMRALIDEVRHAMPFQLPIAAICQGICNGCSKKLLEFLDVELLDWEARLNAGESPKLGDIDKLARMSRKVYQVLQRNQLV